MDHGEVQISSRSVGCEKNILGDLHKRFYQMAGNKGE